MTDFINHNFYNTLQSNLFNHERQANHYETDSKVLNDFQVVIAKTIEAKEKSKAEAEGKVS